MRLVRQSVILCAFIASFAGGTLAQAADGAPVADRSLQGDKVCTACHDASWDKPILGIYKTRHGVKADNRTPGCQTCHGESANHLKSPSNSPDMLFAGAKKSAAQAQTEVCLTCHKGGARALWEGSKHPSNDVSCATCHKVHRNGDDKALVKQTQSEVCFNCHKAERAQIHRMSTHPIAAGKVACSDCHNPHGSEGPKLVAKASVNETCFTCHAEKRGPFLWEHPPAVESCVICHTPHGSTNAGLLKMRSPWLCQQCHGDGAPHPGAIYSGANLPGGTVNTINQPTTGAGSFVNPLTGQKIAATAPANQLMLRGCPNCHSQIHGSNHPAGVYFAR